MITGAPDIMGQNAVDLLASKMALCSSDGFTPAVGLTYLGEMGFPSNATDPTKVVSDALGKAVNDPIQLGPKSGETGSGGAGRLT